MHRRVMCMLVLAALVAGVTGCSEGADETVAAPPTVLCVSGSSACAPLVQLLTDARASEDVQWRYLASPGSGSAIKGAASGDLALGLVSRVLTAEESELGLTYTKLSDDAIVFALHPSVGIEALTTQQVRDIYSGVYTRWSELGGSDLSIVLLDRHEDEPAKMIMRRAVFGDDLVISPRAAALYTEADMVSGVRSTVGAIGYFSLGSGTLAGAGVVYPSLDGVTPSVHSVRDGSYTVIRPLGIVTAGDPDPAVVGLLAWARTDEARTLIESKGYAAAW